MSKLEMIIRAREKDLGGFHVRRILPYATHRMVGPFIFFDHMGPAEFAPGEGMDVRPHPHVNLATVTYLFDGVIHHKDSLGTEQRIEPGAINWMTAGHGIVHSERTPPDVRKSGGRVHGIQCWVALPREFEEVDPAFSHHSSETLPTRDVDGVWVKLLLGSGFGMKSTVPVHSDILYAEAKFNGRSQLVVAGEGRRDLAVYVVEGSVRVNAEILTSTTMAVGKSGGDLSIESEGPARLMILGGEPLAGERFIYWNFVSSSADRVERAKDDWAEGRFPKIASDSEEFIPLPADSGRKTNPPGTMM